MTHDDLNRETGLDRRLEAARRTAEAVGGSTEGRRDELVEHAESRGLSRPAAEQAYDIAREEGLEPAYGLALVLEGVSVQRLESPKPDVDAVAPKEPEWVDTAPGPEEAERERRLRRTFRRLRSEVDRLGDAGKGFQAFRAQPDLEPYDY